MSKTVHNGLNLPHMRKWRTKNSARNKSQQSAFFRNSTISRTLELSLQSLYGEKSEKHWLSQYHPSWMGCELPHDSPLSDQSTRFGTSLPCSRLFPQISDCEPGLLTRFLWQCKKGGRWLNVLFSHVC